MEERKLAQRKMRIIFGILIILILFVIAFIVSIYMFNHKKRQYISGNACADFTVDITLRTGQTDS